MKIMAKYDVRVRYAFEGTYTVVAEDHDEARQMVSEDCGLVLGGNIHTTLDDEDVRGSPRHTDSFRGSTKRERDFGIH